MVKTRTRIDQDDDLIAEGAGSALRDTTHHLDMSELLRAIVELAIELLRADAGEIYLWEQEEGALRLSFLYGQIKAPLGAMLKPGEGLAGRVFQSSEAMIVEDYQAWSGRAEVFDSVMVPFHTTLGVPMRWQDHTVGVLELDADTRRRTFDRDDARLAEIFGTVAAVAIKNTRLYADLQDRSARMQHVLEQKVAQRTAELARQSLQLETSARVSREITSILNLDELLSRVVELICDAFGYYHVNVYLLNADINRLLLQASSGVDDIESRCLELGPGSLNGVVAQTNKALMVNDIALDPRHRADVKLPDTRSELVIPLRVGQRVLGTLDVQSAQVDAFVPEDMLVIQSLGDQIAIAIENARLYDRSQELAVLKERQRLGRDLHDSVTQSLFSGDLIAKAIITHLQRDPQRAEKQVTQLRQIIRDALQEMRTLIFDLNPPSLEDVGIVSALRAQMERSRRPDGPELALQVTGEYGLPMEIERDLYRIAQEALSNAIKHANAQQIVVSLAIEADRVTLCVTDDGRGFDPAGLSTNRRAFGLLGMRERAKLKNGTFDIESQPGAGTRVRFCLPI